MIAAIITIVQNLPLIIQTAYKLLVLYRISRQPQALVTPEQVKEVASEVIKASTAEERQAVASRIATLWSLRKPVP